jgi:carbonic anhydrase|tara:strand:- start:2 stop:229 length:228 start_codon:yes stop_codon:yes gene_type:complete
MQVKNLKIKVKNHFYMGYLQGVKVYINNKKYPIERGYVYANNKNNKAVKTAFYESNLSNDNELVLSTFKKDYHSN